MSDCVISLDHRVSDEISTRRLRVIKYRGSEHGTNEYPFLITARGFRVLPITSMGLAYGAPDERVSSGVPVLDHLMGGGLYRGSTLMISGSAGTGKTTLAAQLVDAACARGERALFLSFEEAPSQLIRNMRSAGLDLGRWVDQGLLRLRAERSAAYGLESHLAALELLLDETSPRVAVLDGVGGLTNVGGEREVTSTVARVIDLLKGRGITAVLTVLTPEGVGEFMTLGVSSLTDTWLALRNAERDRERRRLLLMVKSRGTAHSNQVHEFVLTDHGAQVVDLRVVGPEGRIPDEP